LSRSDFPQRRKAGLGAAYRSIMFRPIYAAALLALSPSFAGEVSPVSDEVRQSFKLDPFYRKQLLVGQFPIVASDKVSDAAIVEAGVIVRGMVGKRTDLLDALAAAKIRLAVMAVSERTCDIPEHSDLTPREHWNRRARGLGPTRIRPAVSAGEENLLNCQGDPYPQENILVHEFAHAIHLIALVDVDPTFDRRLKKTYEEALAAGKWKGTYAATNHAEYWAEGVQSWFGTNRANDAIHNHVDTREKMLEYDPELSALCVEVFGEDNAWQYRRADDPARRSEPHLKDLDRSALPVFRWSESASGE
jgi:hypothetical protein